MKSSFVSSSQPRSVVSGDINNDHHIDFIVANSGTDNIGVFISQQDGSFSNEKTYFTGFESNPRSLAIDDFNNDSYADIVVANYGTNNIGLFIGYENGTFDNQKVTSLGSSHPLLIMNGDFNKDNRMDIAVVNDGTNTIGILLGYGNGSFEQQTTYSTGYDSFPSSLAIGDFDNDTDLDVVVANSGTNSIGIFLNYGNGTFINQYIYTTMLDSHPLSITLGDLNNDKILDIVVANNGTGSVGIFFGHGNGTFLPQVSYTIGSLASPAYPYYVTLNDMKKDHALDIVIVDSRNDYIHVLPGYGNGSFAAKATYDAVSGSMPVGIIVNNLNNNSQADVVLVNYETNNALVLMDYSSKPSVRQTFYHGGDSGMLGGVAVSDFNDDGIFDIVFHAANYIGILIGFGNSTFAKPKTYTIDDKSNTQYVCTRDLNNDNRTDIIVADPGLDSIVVFLGYGNGSFGNMTTYSIGIDSDPWWIALGDLNNDTVVDMVSANYGDNSISILLGYRNGSFALPTNYLMGDDGPGCSVAIDDINNDHRLDIVVSTNHGIVLIYLGQGDSTFTQDRPI